MADEAIPRTLPVGTLVEVREHSREAIPRTLPVGTDVEVREHFRGLWSTGFVVADPTDNGYWIRRTSDRYVLPTPFIDDDVRRRS